MLAFLLYYYSYYYHYYYYQFLIFTIIITIIIMTDSVFINFILLTQSSAWAPIFLIFCPYYYYNIIIDIYFKAIKVCAVTF